MGQPNDEGRDQNAEQCSGRIHGAVEAKRQAADLGRDRIGHESIARRRANALADAVGPADSGNEFPGAGHIEEGLGERRKGVPDHRKGLASSELIREPSGE